MGMSGRAWLVLENGRRFEGVPFGALGEAVGEAVFTTGMTGYLETLTDRSYLGQIVVQTFPLIGNYGIIPSDFESASPVLNAYVVKSWCREPSNFRSEGDLDTFLQSRGIVGLCGIDTRALTKLIREAGVMNGMITRDPDSADMEALRAYRIADAVRRAGTDKPYRVGEEGRFQVCLFDFGLKENIVRELTRRGCGVTVLPPDTAPEAVFARRPDGVMLSNGPGDPADNPDIVRNLRAVAGSGLPVFGICLGHQLLGLAAGGRTTKLKYGHRGANQPVRDLQTGRVYITSQNHGYAVVAASLDPRSARERFRNVNDGTCEGLDYLDRPVFSAQFHPEACGGPRDTAFLFDRFMGMMEVNARAAGRHD
jgi:carbamoyl-phosphate synthase small subunit